MLSKKKKKKTEINKYYTILLILGSETSKINDDKGYLWWGSID